MSGIETLQSRNLRNLIDCLRRIGAHRYVNLPQIIVVGLQSSGKSSVLTILASIFAFPSGSELTTQCPIVVELTNNAEERIFVYSSNSRIPKVRLASPDDIVSAIIRIQHLLLGDTNKIIEDEIFIEIEGPSLPDLTLIDLPGIFKTLMGEQKPEDMEAAKRLTEKYMKESRTIILAVVSAGDPQQNEIIQMAKEVDEGLTRTIVVVTKPDCIDPGTEQNMFHQFERLEVPFHVVRGRGQTERDNNVSPADMATIEREFFEREPWNLLKKGQLGGANLKQKLATLLYERMQKELPVLQRELSKKLHIATKKLADLGPACDDDPLERRKEYERICAELNKIYRSMVQGQFHTKFFRNEQCRFFARVRNLYDVFSEKLYRNLYDVFSEKDGLWRKNHTYAVGSYCDVKGHGWCEIIPTESSSLDVFSGRNIVGEIVEFTRDNINTTPEIAKLISEIRSNRGPELAGTISWNVVKGLIYDLVLAWLPLCGKLVEEIITLLEEVSKLALDDIILSGNRRLRMHLDRCVARVTEETQRRMLRAIDLHFECELQPATQDQDYSPHLKRVLLVQLKEEISVMNPQINRDEVLRLIDTMGASDNLSHRMMSDALQINNILNEYTRIAKRRVIDNVTNSITKELNNLGQELGEACQVTDADLQIFMNEDIELTLKRAELKREVDVCGECLQHIVKFYASDQ